MDKAKKKKVMMLAVHAGEIMLKSGAETYRVEETIERICKACKIDNIDVFALPTGIFVTLNNDGLDDDPYTYVKRIKGGETDLMKISKVNRFSRLFTTTDMTVDEGLEYLDKVDAEKPYPFALRVIGGGFVASFFCMLFEGGWVDFAIAFVLGMLCYMISRFLVGYGINFFVRGMIGCAFATFTSLLAESLIEGASYTPIITGCIMLFVPGVAIVNSIRDILVSEFLSGVARLTETAITGVALATGAGIAMTLWRALGGVIG